MSFPKRIAALSFIVVLAFPCRAAVQDYIPSTPVPPRLVNDFASAFEQYQTDSLETVLVDFDERSSNQISVVTVTDHIVQLCKISFIFIHIEDDSV